MHEEEKYIAFTFGGNGDLYWSIHNKKKVKTKEYSYDPFNIIFMTMYHRLHEIDDVNDIGHQIHIEEYLYNKNKVKRLKN